MEIYNIAYQFLFHQTLKVTPAIEAKITDYVWDIEDILILTK